MDRQGDDRQIPGRGRRPGRPASSRVGTGPIKLSRIGGDREVFDLVHPRCVRRGRARLRGRHGTLESRRPGRGAATRSGMPSRPATTTCGFTSRWGGSPSRSFGTLRLARGHFGYAVDLVRKAIPRGIPGPLPATEREPAVLRRARRPDSALLRGWARPSGSRRPEGAGRPPAAKTGQGRPARSAGPRAIADPGSFRQEFGPRDLERVGVLAGKLVAVQDAGPGSTRSRALRPRYFSSRGRPAG